MRLLTRTSRAEQLAELRAQCTAAEAALARLRAELDDEQHDLRLGYTEVEHRITALAEQIAAQERELAELVQRRDALAAAEAEVRREREKAAAVARERSVPGLVARQLELAAETDAAARRLGELMVDMQANGVRLAAALGTLEAKRAFGAAALRERFMFGFFRYFTAKLPDGATGGQPWLFLPYAVNQHASSAYVLLPEAEQRVLDLLAPVYADRGQAEASRRRRDPAGASLHVVETVKNVFRLIPGRRRGAGGGAPDLPPAA